MKKLLVLAFLVVANAQAAKMATCKQEIRKACGNSQEVNELIRLADAITEGDDCNIIQAHQRESTPQNRSPKRAPERVVFKDKDVLISVVTSDEGAGEARVCSYRKVDLKGTFVETKVNAGRMFAVTSDIGSDQRKNGRIAVITRTNAVQWLVNTDRNSEYYGTPFFNVKDISIDSKNNKVKLTYKSGSTNEVDLDEVLEGLNKFRQCVSGGC